MITVGDIMKGIEYIELSGKESREVSGVFYDSRDVIKDGCFVAMKGKSLNGNRFVDDAVKRGATTIISEENPGMDFPDLTKVVLKDIRKAYSKIVSNFYGNPLKGKYVVGVTGTNGKTTVVSILYKIFSEVSKSVMVGTLGMEHPDVKIKSRLTTPEAGDLYEFLFRKCNLDFKNLIMEVSSAGLAMGRVEGIDFSQAIFTNLSGDHLDFHGSMDAYFSAKLSLFKNLGDDGWGIINLDDKRGRDIIREIDSKYITYGFTSQADVHPLNSRFDINGIIADVMTPKGVVKVTSSLLGRVNLSNILAAIASSIIYNIDLTIIEKAISEFRQVKGRLNFAYKNDFSVIIDYAHSDDALENLLKSVRDIVNGNVILVFGAGGSRDRSKRPRMGKVAAENADSVIVTSDNPRKEDPMEIIDQVISGFPTEFKRFFVEPDREKAIGIGIGKAEKGDMIVIAGKGHEDYQIFADKTVHFDDFEVVRNITGGSGA